MSAGGNVRTLVVMQDTCRAPDGTYPCLVLLSTGMLVTGYTAILHLICVCCTTKDVLQLSGTRHMHISWLQPCNVQLYMYPDTIDSEFQTFVERYC
jgi:hypothetical protein